MELYRLVLFFHVASAAGLFAVLAIEWVSLRQLKKANSYEQAREWAGLWSLLLPLGMPALLVALASGIYLATTTRAWELGWVAVAVPSIVLVAAAGATVGPRRNRLRAALASGSGPLPSEMQLDLRHPLLAASLRWRAALLTGLLFVMSVRPDPALAVIGSFALIGLAWSLTAWRARRADA
jgi:hypothetical protein